MRGGRGVVEGRRLGGRADGRTSVQRGGRGGGDVLEGSFPWEYILVRSIGSRFDRTGD